MKMKTRQKFIIVKKNDTEAKCYNNVTMRLVTEGKKNLKS